MKFENKIVTLIYVLRPTQTRKHRCRSKIASRTQKMFLENSKSIFLLSRRRFCVLTYVALGRKRRIIWETRALNVSPLFLRLCAQATYFEDAEFASRKQTVFAYFSFAHSCNIVSNIDSKCFCINVSSFADASINTKNSS